MITFGRGSGAAYPEYILRRPDMLKIQHPNRSLLQKVDPYAAEQDEHPIENLGAQLLEHVWSSISL